MLIKTDMTEKFAMEISNWKYSGECEVYNLPNWSFMKRENYALCNEEKRKNLYKAYVSNNKELIGFTRVDELDFDVLIGIGVNPMYCGRGFGEEILKMTIEECKLKFEYKPIVLTVRSWNQRAISCYRNAGFSIIKTYLDNEEELLEMEYMMNIQ